MNQIKTLYLDLDQKYFPKAFVYLSKIGWLAGKRPAEQLVGPLFIFLVFSVSVHFIGISGFVMGSFLILSLKIFASEIWLNLFLMSSAFIAFNILKRLFSKGEIDRKGELNKNSSSR